MIELAASILSADFARLGAEVSAACEAGIRRIHVDVMDGHFVPNLSMGPQVVRALRPVCDGYGARLNTHLMIEHPDRFLDAFAEAGAHKITVHAETASPLRPLLARIGARGLGVGVALNPGTPLARLDDVLDEVDLFLVMTVDPGFGGQALIPACLDKVRHLSRTLVGRGIVRPRIAVDGGVHQETIAAVMKAGANVAVVGSGIFNARGSVASNLAQLKSRLPMQ